MTREEISGALADLRYWESTSAAEPGGPTPHEQIVDLIERLLAQEREACAALAETHTTVGASGLKLTPTPGEIARAIRQRGTS